MRDDMGATLRYMLENHTSEAKDGLDLLSLAILRRQNTSDYHTSHLLVPVHAVCFTICSSWLVSTMLPCRSLGETLH